MAWLDVGSTGRSQSYNGGTFGYCKLAFNKAGCPSAGGALPLSLALVTFNSKVGGSARCGRWLYALAVGAESFLDDQYFDWARVLLGAPKWKRGLVISWELGWSSSGSMRAVLDVARHRAYLWSLPVDDLYRKIFIEAQEASVPTWSHLGRKLLHDWGICDFIDYGWSSKHAYVNYVRGCLEGLFVVRCNKARARQKNPTHHLCIGHDLNPLHRDILSARLGWACLVDIRS